MTAECTGVLATHKAHEVPQFLQTQVRALMEKVNGPKPESYSITFTLPADSHILPLFGQEIFKQLVRMHNAHRHPDRYVGIEALMAFDPDINTMQKKLEDGTVIYGEDVVAHELRHYITQQSFKKDPHKPTEVGFYFYWDRIDNDYILCYRAGVEDDLSLLPHQRREVYMAPNNPSWSDVNAYHSTRPFISPVRHLAANPIERSNTEVDFELLDKWLYKNRHLIDSKQFHFNKKIIPLSATS